MPADPRPVCISGMLLHHRLGSWPKALLRPLCSHMAHLVACAVCCEWPPSNCVLRVYLRLMPMLPPLPATPLLHDAQTRLTALEARRSHWSGLLS